MSVIVDSLPDAQHDTLSVDRMRAIFAEELERTLTREVTLADGTTVPLTAEELGRTEVIEREREQAVGVRPLYEVTYREQRVAQQGIMVLGAERFRAHVRYLIGHTAKQLDQMQPGMEWRLAAAMVDPVNMRRQVVRVSGHEPSPEEVAVRLANTAMRPTTERDQPPLRVSQIHQGTYDESDWRWYMRMVWFGVGDFRDPGEQAGGRTALSKYAETRQLRHLPPGTRRNREAGLALMARVGARAAVAPVPALAPDQVDAAREMLAAGVNAALVARALNVAPAAVTALLGEPEAPVKPGRRAPR